MNSCLVLLDAILCVALVVAIDTLKQPGSQVHQLDVFGAAAWSLEYVSTRFARIPLLQVNIVEVDLHRPFGVIGAAAAETFHPRGAVPANDVLLQRSLRLHRGPAGLALYRVRVSPVTCGHVPPNCILVRTFVVTLAAGNSSWAFAQMSPVEVDQHIPALAEQFAAQLAGGLLVPTVGQVQLGLDHLEVRVDVGGLLHGWVLLAVTDAELIDIRIFQNYL